VKKRCFRPSKAFTLTEILVSSSILIILVLILLALGERVARFWQSSEGRRETDREITSALAMMAGDLRNAVLEKPNRSTLFIGTSSGIGGESLFFPAVEHKSTEGSSLHLIGYFVAEDPSRDGISNLYRFDLPWPNDGRPFSKNVLESLYSKASAGDPSTTELLARHISAMHLLPQPESSSSLPEVLEVSLEPQEKRGSLNVTGSATEFLPLPPWRDLPTKP
jgi:type II secretory pathway pseudopilin PulG